MAYFAPVSEIISLHGIDKLVGLTWQARLECNQQTKRVFRRKAQALMPPASFVEKLPTQPSGYQELYPDEFKRIYETNLPVSCPMGEARVRHAQELIPRRNTRRGVANEKNHEHSILRQSDMMGSFLQPMLQTMMQQFMPPGSVLQPSSASASASSVNGLQIQMLAPASGPKPLPPSRSIENKPEEPQAEQAKEENESKEDGKVNMEVATETGAKPSPTPTKEGKGKVAVEMCTETILAGLHQREAEKTKGKIKAVAKSKSKAKGTTKPITAPAPLVLPTVAKAKGKSKAYAGKVVPTIAKPKPGKPVCFGQCNIMHGADAWRVTTAANRRFDKKFSFKRPGAWDDLVSYCLANK